MKKWMAEDWEFELVVTCGIARNCRLGLETGDKFIFQYECPAGICPRVMTELHTWCEIIRNEGNFIPRGCKEKYEMDLSCPCQCIHFHLTAKPINRDENGVYNGISKRPPIEN
jgi:uncharacterized repeat protein (TIGR04076 family)